MHDVRNIHGIVEHAIMLVNSWLLDVKSIWEFAFTPFVLLKSCQVAQRWNFSHVKSWNQRLLLFLGSAKSSIHIIVRFNMRDIKCPIRNPFLHGRIDVLKRVLIKLKSIIHIFFLPRKNILVALSSLTALILVLRIFLVKLMRNTILGLKTVFFLIHNRDGSQLASFDVKRAWLFFLRVSYHIKRKPFRSSF